MTRIGRIRNILIGVGMILSSYMMIRHPDVGIYVIAAFISLGLTVSALRSLVYYFSMARYMVEGRVILLRGIIMLDAAVFLSTMITAPGIYVIIYLLVAHLFYGAVDILRGMEAREYGGNRWKMSIITGAVNIIVALAALAAGIIQRSQSVVVYIYCAGLILTGIQRIFAAFQKSEMVYIQ